MHLTYPNKYYKKSPTHKINLKIEISNITLKRYWIVLTNVQQIKLEGELNNVLIKI